jgi:hypothetical protein
LPYMFGTLGVSLPHLPHLPHPPNRAHTLCTSFRSLGKQALNDSEGWWDRPLPHHLAYAPACVVYGLFLSCYNTQNMMHSTTQHLSGDVADGDSRPRSHGARREMQAYAAGGGWAVDRRVRSADLARRFCCLRAGEFPMVMIGGSSFFSTPSPSLARCGRVKHFFLSVACRYELFLTRAHNISHS